MWHPCSNVLHIEIVCSQLLGRRQRGSSSFGVANLAPIILVKELQICINGPPGVGHKFSLCLPMSHFGRGLRSNGGRWFGGLGAWVRGRHCVTQSLHPIITLVATTSWHALQCQAHCSSALAALARAVCGATERQMPTLKTVEIVAVEMALLCCVGPRLNKSKLTMQRMLNVFLNTASYVFVYGEDVVYLKALPGNTKS